MSSLSLKTVNILQSGLIFIDAAVMWALEPLGPTMYIYIYIYICIIIRVNVTYEGFRVLTMYRQNTNIKRSCDAFIQLSDNKTTNAFEHPSDAH